MRLNCSMCGSDRYVVISIAPGRLNYASQDMSLLSDSFYIQKNQCLKCSTITSHTVDYITDPKRYKYINVEGHVTQFHRYIYELIHFRKLKPGERVIHINKIRGDNRPSNLKAIMPRVRKKREINRKILVCSKCKWAWKQARKIVPKRCPRCHTNNWK